MRFAFEGVQPGGCPCDDYLSAVTAMGPLKLRFQGPSIQREGASVAPHTLNGESDAIVNK